MKTAILLLACMSSAHSICVAAPEKTKCGREVHSGLKVSLGMDSHYFKIGETVPIKVWIENSGESVLKIPVLMEPEDYWLRFEITDSAGKALTFTGPETKKMYQDRSAMLLPGNLFGTKLDDLTSFYKIREPGVYAIRAIYGRAPTGNCELGDHFSPVVNIEMHK